METKAGAASGATFGTIRLLDVINSHTAFETIMTVVLTAFATGFIGALGAHLFKILVKRYKRA
jgi:hypothetical protein